VDIEIILAISCVLSGVFCLCCTNKNIGKKLAGFYKEDGNHHSKQIQMLVTGLLGIGFGFWWVFNPGLLTA
jgi:hypothetical protein